MKRSLCVITALTALFLSATALPLPAEETAASPSLIAKQDARYLPPLHLESSNKGAVSTKNWRNKVTIIDVWASWCGPCRKQIPTLHTLKKKYGSQIEIVGISLDRDEGDHKQAIKALNIDYPSCWARNKVNGKFLKSLEKTTGTIRGIPYLVIADRFGNIVYASSGMLDQADLEKIIYPIIRKKG